MSARCVAVLGTTSGAGKSYLATALCRWYANAGYRVAPFKAQNMSNNARVVATPGGGVGEIGSAQYFQALAARAVPDVRMNPVLLKPEAEMRSQVIVDGRVRADLAEVPWRERSALLWPHAWRALQALGAEHEVIVIEGAGSPAEINLAATDYVNTKTVIAADAAALLIADIDRGGAFAHLFGTHSLVDPGVRRRLRGFVLNKFRGDEALLAPGPQQLERLTGVPTLAVLPMDREHGLPEEDGVFDTPPAHGPCTQTVAVIAPPQISNLDEFQPLARLPGVRLLWARKREEAAQAHWLVLPGSKHTRADLQWLRAQGLDLSIEAHLLAGKPLLAICGGLQMMGRAIADPLGIDGGDAGGAPGLGVLPLHTEFGAHKQLQRHRVRLATLHGPWAALSGLEVEGYEIRAGRSTLASDGDTDCIEALPGALGWQRGPVLALALHGLLENPSVLKALFGAHTPGLDARFDRLAERIEQRFTRRALLDLLR
jgi:adenosylcobyric acid synthase